MSDSPAGGQRWWDGCPSLPLVCRIPELELWKEEGRHNPLAASYLLSLDATSPRKPSLSPSHLPLRLHYLPILLTPSVVLISIFIHVEIANVHGAFTLVISGYSCAG